MQRFDLMAITTKILEERKSGTGMIIADVRLVDGSKQHTATEYASLPLTLFFKDAAELNTFKNYIGKTPLLFMCLAGGYKDSQVSVSTQKSILVAGGRRLQVSRHGCGSSGVVWR